MDYYQRQERRRRAILELAIIQAGPSNKKEFRELFAALEAHGWAVTAYRRRMELALSYVDKAVKAIEALES